MTKFDLNAKIQWIHDWWDEKTEMEIFISFCSIYSKERLFWIAFCFNKLYFVTLLSLNFLFKQPIIYFQFVHFVFEKHVHKHVRNLSLNCLGSNVSRTFKHFLFRKDNLENMSFFSHDNFNVNNENWSLRIIVISPFQHWLFKCDQLPVKQGDNFQVNKDNSNFLLIINDNNDTEKMFNRLNNFVNIFPFNSMIKLTVSRFVCSLASNMISFELCRLSGPDDDDL